MEAYIVNGQELAFDTFDLVNMELFESEVQRIAAIERKQADNDFAYVREVCEGICDFFDTLVGEGTAEKCFGGRRNAKELLDAYTRFVMDVQEKTLAAFAEYGAAVSGYEGAAPDPVNREQRRAMERQKRREEARQRAERKKKVTALEG